jgi:WD40 repeat protein
MAVWNTSTVRPSGSVTGASAAQGGKHKLLSNGQVIDCVGSSSSSNVPRYHARSVAWNRTGSLLAVGCSDATIRLWNPVQQQPSTELSSATPCKDVGSITGQGGPIIAATFHPTADHLLGTCSVAGSLRLWDVRGSNTLATVSSSPTCVGSTTTIASSPIVVAVEWNPVQTHIVAVATHDGSVFIYDTRKLSNATSATSKGGSMTSSTSAALLRHVQFEANDRMESCLFDRASGGQYLLAGVTNREQNYGMGCIKISKWDTDDDMEEGTDTAKKRCRHWSSFPAHAGSIFAMAFNGSGTQLATGGADAVVGVWDVATMACCTALSSRTKSIRSLSFAPDDSILAIATEEDVIELVDGATPLSTRVGLASLSGSSGRHRTAGAEDIAFHPTAQYLLACARTFDPNVGGNYATASPVSLVKLSISQ